MNVCKHGLQTFITGFVKTSYMYEAKGKAEKKLERTLIQD